MSNRVWIALSILLAATLALIARAADPVPPARQPNDNVLRIGVVNAGKVYDSMNELKDTMAGLQQQATNFADTRRTRGQEIQTLETQIRQLKEDSPQWTDVRKQWEQKSVALKAQDELWNVEIQRQQKAVIKAAHQRVVEATQNVAKERHLNLVIADSDPDLSTSHLEQFNGPQLRLLLGSRAVFYADDKADITQEVLARLEADYAARKQGGPAK